MLHVLCCASLTFSPAPPRAAIATTRLRSTAPVALLAGPPGSIDFEELDLPRCTSFLRSFPSKFRGWGAAEWKLFGLPALPFSTRPIDGGVALVYYLSEDQARASGRGGAAVEDGGRLEITAAEGGAGLFAPGPRIVLRSKRGSADRSRHEAVLAARLADECRSTATSFGKLSPRSWRPPRVGCPELARPHLECHSSRAA